MSRLRRVRWPAAVAVAVGVLVGCGSDESSTATVQGGSVEAPASEAVPTEGLVTASGAGFDFADTEGRDVLLWFWAPW